MKRRIAKKLAKSSNQNFNERCYKILRKVPAGSVTTYGDLARQMGTKAFRAVGRAMNKNPYAPEVPCHRVVCSDGKLGGYAFGTLKKTAILKREGVTVRNGKIINFKERLHRF